MEKKVSIIIPAYKVEDYIEHAIRSCIEQTYANIEIVVVDDGSPDKTWNVIQEMAIQDVRVHAMQQKNQGVSMARNTAMKAATGEFMIFLDSDDWLEPDAVESLLQWQEQHPDKLVMSGKNFAYLDNKKNIEYVRQHIGEPCQEVDRETAMLQISEGIGLTSGCYKIFRSEIIQKHKIEFDTDIYHGEDGLFVFRYLHYTKGLYFCPKPLWNILERPQSATTGGYNKRWLTAEIAVDRMMQCENTEAVQKFLQIYKIDRIVMVMRAALETGAQDAARGLQKKLQKYTQIYLNSKSTKRRKIYFIGMAYLPLVVLRKILYLVCKNG